MKCQKIIIPLALITMCFFLTACDEDIEREIMYTLLYGGHDDTDNAQQNADTPSINNGNLEDFPAPMDCTKVTNAVKDPQSGICLCKPGYTERNRQCVSESSPEAKKECVFDRDCSPEGVMSKCTSTDTKAVYRCDLQTYRCIGGKGNVAEYVSCKEEYGTDYTCKNGMCVQQ